MIRGLALGSSIAALALVLVWELSPADKGRDRAAALAAPPGTRAAPVPRFDADETVGVAAVLISRPLFSPDRRPSGRSTKPSLSEASDTSSPPRLAGTIVGPEGGRAIFAETGGKARSAAVGDKIGAFTIQDIAAGAVTVVGPGGPRQLHPTYISPQPASGLVRSPGSPR